MIWHLTSLSYIGQLNCIYKDLQRRCKVLALLIKHFAQRFSRCECPCGLLRFLFIDQLPVMISLLKPSRVKIIYYYFWLKNVKKTESQRKNYLNESLQVLGQFKKNFAKKNMVRHELSGRQYFYLTIIIRVSCVVLSRNLWMRNFRLRQLYSFARAVKVKDPFLYSLLEMEEL